jgi:NAD(P)-dependent dehydrogenase (short-subunit alcohol dehydrogenase family)
LEKCTAVSTRDPITANASSHPDDVNGSLEGKVAIVTGAGRGIGRACAVRLAYSGADVAVLDVDLRSGARYAGEPDDLTTEEIESLGRRARGVQVDLTDERAAHEAIASVVSELGGLDILVNIAGGAITPYARSRPSLTTAADFRTLIDVNMMSAIFCCQAAIPTMRAAGGGAIVNTASTAAFTVFPDGSNSAYAMTKAAIAHWSRHLAAELGPDQIRVNMIAPGITLTGRVVEESSQTGHADRAIAEVPLRRLGQPEDCAKVVEFLVSDASSFVTGRCIPVDGGWVLNPS